MLIANAAKIKSNDIIQFSWFSLRRFHNEEQTTDLIIQLHNLGPRYRQDAQKQAKQIRYFLAQAKDYFDASKSVGLTTRPVLLYYCVLCLVTAEILIKGSGAESIDYAREQHRHHGLVFNCDISKNEKNHLFIKTGQKLVAKPATRGRDERFGTFELWHRSARSVPMCGIHTISHETGANTEQFTALGRALDKRFNLLPTSGISFYEACRNIPGMTDLFAQIGQENNFVRTRISTNVKEISKRSEITVVVQPQNKSKVDQFYSLCQFNANDIDCVIFNQLPSGGIITVTSDINRSARWSLPAGTMTTSTDYLFFLDNEYNEILNEFGYIYLALYIAGNYARYFPDYWINDIERSTELGMFIEHLLNISEQRIPLLALSELSRTFFVPE